MTPHSGMAAKLHDQRAAARTMPATQFMLLGARMTGHAIQAFIRDDLGIADDADIDGVARTLTDNLARPLVVPSAIADVLASASIAADDVALARHLGFDPLRLLASAAEGIARVNDGNCSYRVIPRFKDRKIDKVDIAFRLATGAVWRGGKLTVEKIGMPATIAAAMRGKTMDEIVGHGWEGWKTIRAEDTSISASRLTVTSGSRPTVALVSC